jgi:amidase
MNKTDLAFTSTLELSQLIRKKEISPLELTQLYLERIGTLNDRLGSFSYIAKETALKDAQEKTEQIANLKDTSELPPLFGIPTAIKDLYAVQGMPCGYGNAMIQDNISNYDEGFVTRIKQAGMIILGKTATSEFGSLPYTESPGLPPSRNPWHLDYTSGGSSGGAAAAVAAGLIPIAPGSDGGGSVRGPAFCCGLVGLKPSRGRISNAPVGDYQAGIATHGCLSRNVTDSAALLDVLSGYITGDPYWLPNPEIPFLDATQKSFDKLKIAFATSTPPTGEASVIIKKQVEDTTQILTDLGHSLTEACPDFSSLVEPFSIIWRAGITNVKLPAEALNPMNQWLKQEASSLGEYLQAVHQMQIICRQIVAFFDNFDVLLLPTYLQPPIKVGEWADLTPSETLSKIISWINPCPPFNTTGQPAIAIPTGFTEEGLPVGVQLIGKPAAESTILSLAYQLEKIKCWSNHRPSLL